MNPPASTNESTLQKDMLSREDIRLLLNEPAPEARIAVARKIAAGHGSGQFNESELEVAEQIFRLLLRDAEVRVRAALADGLKEDITVPKDIIKSLAGDVAEVSTPVLEHSEVLKDGDLLEIIRTHNDITKYIAIANRKSVSGTVSAALVNTGEEVVVGDLVRNAGAQITEESYRRIVETFPTSQKLLDSMVERANLPVTVVERLLTAVSDTVAQELKRKYADVAKKLEEESRKAREQMTLKLLDNTVQINEVQTLVAQMHDSKRLTPSIILTALCRGNFTFFEVSLAKMAGIPPANARKLIHDKGELGFRSLYKKAGLPESLFDACRLVLDVMREMAEQGDSSFGNIHYANRVVEKILLKSRGSEVENLAYIIALIRQNVR